EGFLADLDLVWFVNCLVNDAQNPTIPPGGAAEIKFKGPEISPFDVKCSIHPWMKAMVVAFDHPYVGVSDANGVVEIKNIPAGTELTFRANHEAATGKLDGLKQDGKSVTWRANRFKVEIKPGVNDMGIITVPAAVFGRK
ncbi:MAG: hypothetical protein AAFN70_02430, partial [Planctomycetota bacterium]